MSFEIESKYQPSGDQPEAIRQLTDGVNGGLKYQTLLGVTGSGKTFTMANLIQNVQKPTLIIAHNKTLAAQLSSEFRSFFPKNAVEYFVSYYDYYQPEAYLPRSDTYIEKEATINSEIDRLRHSATQAILSRKDTIVVASVSCIYGLGSPENYLKAMLVLRPHEEMSREHIIERLLELNYERNDTALTRGKFRARGETIEVVPVNDNLVYRILLNGDTIEAIDELDYVTRESVASRNSIVLYPATHFVMPKDEMATAVKSIRDELETQLEKFKSEGKLIEAERLRRRTIYDLEMIQEVGYCTGIENYSRHFDRRSPGEPPTTLIDYFGDDFLMIVDESHVTIPQINGMYAGDEARKNILVDNGFRLPSAKDNRPLKFGEFEKLVNQCVFTTATPSVYELKCSGQVVEQIIRPTGLIDPEVIIKPSTGQIEDLCTRIDERIAVKERVLVTTLTKKMAEELAGYLTNRNVKVKYLHSDIETIERVEIIQDLRKGVFDVLIGVNLLREGLDMPEVSLVAILDADQEGFLRSETSLIQTIGRAARNVNGQVVLYADEITGSIKRAMDETARRREIQLKHNSDNHITPQSISKEIVKIMDAKLKQKIELDPVDIVLAKSEREELIKQKERQMKKAATDLQFELAALLRDEISRLRQLS